MASINALRPALAAPQRIGLAFSIFSSLSYGSSPVFVRFAYEAGAGPLTLLAFRYVLACIAISAALLLSGRSFAMPAGRPFGGDTTAGADPMAVTLHATAAAALIFVPLAALNGSLGFPGTMLGLVGVAGVAVTYLAGVLTFYAALVRIGPMKAALLAQLEPIVSILCAVLILEEQLSLVQGLGVALVLGALMTLAR